VFGEGLFAVTDIVVRVLSGCEGWPREMIVDV